MIDIVILNIYDWIFGHGKTMMFLLVNDKYVNMYEYRNSYMFYIAIWITYLQVGH